MTESDHSNRSVPSVERRTPDTGGHDPVTGRIGQGRDVEFTVFYRSWTKRLVGFLIMQGADLELAAELVQETMSVLYRRWAEVEHPRAWAFTTASRALVRSLAEVREVPTAETPEPSPLLLSNGPGIDHWESRHVLLPLIRGLPARQRQVMAWTLHGYTPAEIAERLQLGVEAVRANLYQARRSLSARLAEEGR